jgi:hypothetical protein
MLVQNEGENKQPLEIFFKFNPKKELIKHNLSINLSMVRDVLESNGSGSMKKTTELLGQSNIKSGKEISYDTTFILDYFFQKEQIITMDIIDHTKSKTKREPLGTFKTTLGTLVGSKNQTFSLQNNLGELFLYAKKHNHSDDLGVDFQIYFNYPKEDIQPFYLIKRNLSKENPKWINSYKSEVNLNFKNEKNFSKCSLNITMLTIDGSLVDLFMIEFYDKKTKNLLGTLKTTVAMISDEKYIGYLLDENQKKINNSYVKFSCEVVEDYKFVDFLRGGLQLSMIFGIDFTASNGEPDKETSLHYINSNSLNDYQRAIRSCGDIVAFYDYDQMFPVFGYGAKIGNSKEASFCFNCNFKQDPNVNSIDEVLNVYKSTLNKVTLYGPTYFSPVIGKAIEIAKKTVENKDYIYSILIILTDGKINDMKQTIDCIIQGSYLPLSIIIIGIGNADFSDMYTLDSDDIELIDSKGNKGARDIVQFVPMNIFENSIILAEKVLEEIPKQLIDYFKLIREPPREPNVFLC